MSLRKAAKAPVAPYRGPGAGAALKDTDPYAVLSMHQVSSATMAEWCMPREAAQLRSDCSLHHMLLTHVRKIACRAREPLPDWLT